METLYRVVKPRIVKAITGKSFRRREYVLLDSDLAKRAVRLRALRKSRTQKESIKQLGLMSSDESKNKLKTSKKVKKDVKKDSVVRSAAD